MSSSQIIEQLSAQFNIEPQTAAKLMNSLTAAIKDYCLEMDSVAIPGFGTFSPKKTEERLTEDPTTGSRRLLPPRIDVEFNTSVVLRKKFVG